MLKSVIAAAAGPLIVAAALMSVPHLSERVTSPLLPVKKLVSQTALPHVPRYPLSAKITHKALLSPFGFPLVRGVKEFTSPVYQLPIRVPEAEAWYTRVMERQGYTLLSRGVSSSQNAAAVTDGLEFAKGVENSQQAALTFQSAGAGASDMQYMTMSFALPKRPVSTMISNPDTVKTIAVVYHTWRYGAPSQNFVITNRREIDQIVHILNVLPPSSPMPEGCAADFGQGAKLTIDFVNHQHWLVTDSAACETVRIPGAPPLTDVGSKLYQTLGQDRPKT
jgi:hypothetical protein